jgi:hypothetical protein
MALTLVTHPVGTASKKLFAGFLPIEFIFKREDLAITGVTSGTGGAKITVGTDLTTYLSEGDSIYLYSEGTDYVYDTTGIILSITSTEITIDAQYVETGTGGYINYRKNYYVEMQCVSKQFTTVNLLPFSLQSDGDAAGNISIDVSIMNDLNRQRGAISQKVLTESSNGFYVQYRQVYTGSSESFTLDNTKLLITAYATEQPVIGDVLNKFDVPQLYLGYPGAIAVANEGGVTSTTVALKYDELDINQIGIAAGNLGTLANDANGFLLWKWLANASINDSTKYVNFYTQVTGIAPFKTPDFASPSFVTT